MYANCSWHVQIQNEGDEERRRLPSGEGPLPLVLAHNFRKPTNNTLQSSNERNKVGEMKRGELQDKKNAWELQCADPVSLSSMVWLCEKGA